MVVEQRNPAFVPAKCRCGRMLRARWDLLGTEIRCWDCHELVMVPIPRSSGRAPAELWARLRETTERANLARLAWLAAILAGALTIPTIGVGVAGLVLTLLAASYGETIRRGDTLPARVGLVWRDWPRPRSIAEGVACCLLVAGTIVPLWVIHAGPRRSPHLDPIGLVILALTWAVMPLAIALVYAEGPGKPSNWRRPLWPLRRHVGVLIAALAIVPIGFVATEAWLDLMFFVEGGLPFFALEHMPMPGNPFLYNEVPHYGSIDFRYLPQEQFYRGYFEGLRNGYSFVGSMPPSLSLPTRAGLSPRILDMLPIAYAIVRFLIVTLIVTCMLAAFSVQARWLGYLTLLERSSRPEPIR